MLPLTRASPVLGFSDLCCPTRHPPSARGRRVEDLRAAAEAEAQRAAAKSAALEARLAELGTRLAEEAELRQAQAEGKRAKAQRAPEGGGV